MLVEDKRDIFYLYAYSIFYSLVTLSTLPLGIQAIIGLIQAGTVSINWIILSAIVTLGVIAMWHSTGHAIEYNRNHTATDLYTRCL